MGTANNTVLNNTVNQLMNGQNFSWEALGSYGIVVACVLGVVLLLCIIQAIMVGGLAKSKGYSFFGNFILGLFFGLFALIYEAGRPISYERECVMQDRLAIQTAKELYKLQRAREKADAMQRADRAQ